jgi:hypothetical protein
LELRSYDDDLNGVKVATKDDEEEKKAEGVEEVKVESEMRGVHAKSDIPADSICVLIPRKCLITVEMGQATEIGQIILNSDLDLDAPKHIFLMIFLLWDRKVNGDKSFFKPYYDILPKTLKNIPIFWEDYELEYLKGSYLLTQIAERIEAITDDYESICQVAPQLKQLATLEEFKWARMIVCSRNFGLQIDGRRTSALVPHADMLNHQRPRETKWSFDDDLDAFTITTLQNIPASSQVFDSYGQKCNHRFLLNYGFAVEDNRELDGFCPNEVPIELSLSPDDELYNDRYEFWIRSDSSANNIQGNLHSAVIAAAAAQSLEGNSQPMFEAFADALNEHVLNLRNRTIRFQSVSSDDSSLELIKRVRVCASNNENTKHLFSMLRVLSADQEELKTMANAPRLPFGDTGNSLYFGRAFSSSSSEKPNGTDSSGRIFGDLAMYNSSVFRTCRDIRHPISLRNEKAAMKLLLNIVSSALQEYSCSLAQDISDLMNEDVYPKYSNKRHAKIQVRGEKEVFHHFASWAQTAIEMIEVIELEVENEKNGVSSDSKSEFESMVKIMESDDLVHFHVLRYCVDVLGTLRTNAIHPFRNKR